MIGFQAIDGYKTKYKIIKEGSGWKRVKPKTIVTVHATGIVKETGEIFWSTKGKQQPFMYEHGAGQVVTGWEQGCLGMRVGEKRQLIIPAAEGFGVSGKPERGIPPGATIEFTIHVREIL